MTDHAEAAAELLAIIVKRLAAGEAPEDLGPLVVLIGRMMARKI